LCISSDNKFLATISADPSEIFVFSLDNLHLVSNFNINMIKCIEKDFSENLNIKTIVSERTFVIDPEEYAVCISFIEFLGQNLLIGFFENIFLIFIF
jgi:hypothetical protein